MFCNVMSVRGSQFKSYNNSLNWWAELSIGLMRIGPDWSHRGYLLWRAETNSPWSHPLQIQLSSLPDFHHDVCYGASPRVTI